MGRKQKLLDADREGRAALCPEWLREGRKVWFWRAAYCLAEGECADRSGSCCPLNNGCDLQDRAVRGCAAQHPMLESETVWSVAALFRAWGVAWSINDMDPIGDGALAVSVFPTREEALRHRPGRV